MGTKKIRRFGRRQYTLWGAALAVAVATLVSTLYWFGFFERLEWISFDQRTALFRADKAAHPDVAIVLVDEASLKALDPLVGRWPWPRAVHADLVDFLRLGEPRAIVFDMLFTESEGRGGRTLGASDRRLVTATRESGNVYHAFQTLTDEAEEGDRHLLNRPLPEDFRRRFSVGEVAGLPAGHNNNFYIPRVEYYRAARGMGVVEFGSDADGVFRRTRLLRDYQGAVYPVLSMVSLMDMLGTRSVRIENKRLQFTNHEIPVASDGTYLINMYGRFNAYSYSGLLASAQKLRRGETDQLLVSPDEFRNKIVFIGGSAAGVEDLKTTSVSKGMPGVMLHASIVSNVLTGDYLTTVPRGVTVALIVAMALTTGLGILFVPRQSLKIALSLGMILAYLGWTLLQFRANVVYEIVAPVAGAIASWLATFGFLAFTEGKDKRRVRTMLSQYVSPHILSELVDKYEDQLNAEIGRRERITVLFSDVRGFTGLSESLPPESVVEILNLHFGTMSDVIFAHEGTLDKFIGDALMAFWGAPLRANDHARRAVSAALDMQQRLAGVNAELTNRGLPAIDIGIGINTGEVILGNVGSEKKLDYTAIGDNVNLASRLEGLTKQYRCTVLISESTHREVADQIPCLLVDQVRVKGKNAPVRIYRPLAGPGEDAETLRRARDLAAIADQAFTAYAARDWRAASALYEQLGNDNPLGEIFRARCAHYLAHPPAPEWDGVFVSVTK